MNEHAVFFCFPNGTAQQEPMRRLHCWSALVDQPLQFCMWELIWKLRHFPRYLHCPAPTGSQQLLEYPYPKSLIRRETAGAGGRSIYCAWISYSNSKLTQRQQRFRQLSHPWLDALHDSTGFGKRAHVSLEAQGNEPGR